MRVLFFITLVLGLAGWLRANPGLALEAIPGSENAPSQKLAIVRFRNIFFTEYYCISNKVIESLYVDDRYNLTPTGTLLLEGGEQTLFYLTSRFHLLELHQLFSVDGQWAAEYSKDRLLGAIDKMVMAVREVYQLQEDQVTHWNQQIRHSLGGNSAEPGALFRLATDIAKVLKIDQKDVYVNEYEQFQHIAREAKIVFIRAIQRGEWLSHLDSTFRWK